MMLVLHVDEKIPPYSLVKTYVTSITVRMIRITSNNKGVFPLWAPMFLSNFTLDYVSNQVPISELNCVKLETADQNVIFFTPFSWSANTSRPR